MAPRRAGLMAHGSAPAMPGRARMRSQRKNPSQPNPSAASATRTTRSGSASAPDREEQAELQYNRHLILDQAALLPFMAQTNRNSRQRHRKGHGTQLTPHFPARCQKVPPRKTSRAGSHVSGDDQSTATWLRCDPLEPGALRHDAQMIGHLVRHRRRVGTRLSNTDSAFGSSGVSAR